MKRRLLAGLLCICLVVQCQMPVMAAEPEQSAAEEIQISDSAEETEDTKIPDATEEPESTEEGNESESTGEPAAEEPENQTPESEEEVLQVPDEETGEDAVQTEESGAVQTADTEQQYTADEIAKIMEMVPEVHVYINLSTALSDSLFGDLAYSSASGTGFSWKQESSGKETALVASDNAPEQTYRVIYRQPGYADLEFPVDIKVTKINKVTLTGDKYLTQAKEYRGTCGLQFTVTGAEVDEEKLTDLLDVSWSVSKNGYVSLSSDGLLEKEYTGDFGISDKASISDKITAVVTFKGIEKPKTNVTRFSSSLAVQLLRSSLADRLQIQDVKDGEHTNVTDYQADYEDESLAVLSVNLEHLKELKADGIKKYMIDLKTTAYEGEEQLDTAAVKWTTSDSSVVSVSMINKEPVLVLKGKGGFATITATCTDKNKTVSKFKVEVLDHTPVVDTKKLTVNVYKEDGTDFTIFPMNGNGISDVEVSEYDTRTKEYVTSDNFIAEQISDEDDTIWTLSILDDSEAAALRKNRTYKCCLTIETDQFGAVTQNLSVTVDTKKPTVKLKCVQKLNVFRLDDSGEGIYQITGTPQIASAEWTPSRTAESAPYITGEYSEADGRLHFHSEQLDKTNYSKLLQKKYAGGTLKLSFKGYKETADQVISLSVSVENKKNFSVQAEKAVICPSEGLIGRMITVRDKTTGEEILFDKDTDKVKSKTSGCSVEIEDNGRVDLTYTGTKSTDVQFTWDSAKYAASITITVPVVVVKQPTFTLEHSTVYLNTNAVSEVAVRVDVSGTEYPLDSCTLSLSSGLRKLQNSGDLDISYDEDDQMIYLKLLHPENIIKAGTYTITLSGKVAEVVGVKERTLTVKIVTAAPTATVTGSGSIDLLNRENTYMSYKAVLKNITGEIEDAELTGLYADNFLAEVQDDGSIRVYAAGDGELCAKKKYQLRLKLYLDNGCEVTSAAFNVTPVEKLPKLTSNVSKLTFYRAFPIDRLYQIKVPIGSSVKIEDIRLVASKNADFFEYSYEDDGAGILSLKEASALKPGTYSLSFLVYYEGKGITSKPVTRKLSVTIK